MTYDLSILIPSRNEQFLSRTVEGILNNMAGRTEVIVVLDGSWSNPGLKRDPRVTVVYNPTAVGQRAATNQAARLSKAKYVMKCDAHVLFKEGFDLQMMSDMKDHYTMFPRQYNLHAFDWKCRKCGNRWYQGPQPVHCMKREHVENPKCDGKEFEQVVVWQPRMNRMTDFMRFDSELHFQYWGELAQRLESKGDIADSMSLLGACWMVTRERYHALNLSDEKHGSWGQQGTEVACKTWLSGGRLVVDKNTFFSHMFRTQAGFGFPYPNPGIHKAQEYSKNLWRNNLWEGQKYPLSWLVERFWPVKGWTDDDLSRLQQKPLSKSIVVPKIDVISPQDFRPSRGIVYYTDNKVPLKLGHRVRKTIGQVGLPIVSASLKPMDFGENIHIEGVRGYLTMARQQLAALEKSTADIIYFCEHDVFYPIDHFDFIPPKKDVYYYNTNFWRVRASDGFAIHYDTEQVNLIVAYRDLLLQYYQKRVKMMEDYLNPSTKIGEGYSLTKFVMRMGFEPGTHTRSERIDNYKAERFQSKYPCLDIRHDNNLTASRWRQDQFRNQKNCQGWKETYLDLIPGWTFERDAFVR